jgi:hypothetical protein
MKLYEAPTALFDVVTLLQLEHRAWFRPVKTVLMEPPESDAGNAVPPLTDTGVDPLNNGDWVLCVYLDHSGDGGTDDRYKTGIYTINSDGSSYTLSRNQPEAAWFNGKVIPVRQGDIYGNRLLYAYNVETTADGVVKEISGVPGGTASSAGAVFARSFSAANPAYLISHYLGTTAVAVTAMWAGADSADADGLKYGEVLDADVKVVDGDNIEVSVDTEVFAGDVLIMVIPAAPGVARPA